LCVHKAPLSHGTINANTLSIFFAKASIVINPISKENIGIAFITPLGLFHRFFKINSPGFMNTPSGQG